jgi:hypothetical protein
MEFLPKPEMLRSCVDKSVTPHLAVRVLRWHPDAPGSAERAWHLPQGVCLHSPAPERFGIAIERFGDDAYKMHLQWNDLGLTWSLLTRVQIMTSSLSLILRALGMDLWRLLQEPADQRIAA